MSVNVASCAVHVIVPGPEHVNSQPLVSKERPLTVHSSGGVVDAEPSAAPSLLFPLKRPAILLNQLTSVPTFHFRYVRDHQDKKFLENYGSGHPRLNTEDVLEVQLREKQDVLSRYLSRRLQIERSIA